MPFMPGATQALQWPGQWEATQKWGANPQTRSWCRLRAETRPHEAGIGSNGGSARPP